MATLAHTQQQLFLYLQDKPSSIDRLVTGRTPAEVQRRLNIYREAYQLRLSNHLAQQFLVVRAYLSGPVFDQLAQVYIDSYPPSHFALRNFGDRLSDLLANQEPYRERPYLAELAKLEWRLNQIIDQSACAPVLTTAHLQTIKPEALAGTCFQLQPHVRFERFGYDMPPWRDALKKATKPLAPPVPQASDYALWRKGFQTYYRSLNAIEWRLAQGLQESRSFAELCAIALDHDPTASEDSAAQTVVQALLTWIQDGWFTDSLTLND